MGAEHHGSGCDGRVDVLLRRRLQRNGCNEGERVQGGWERRWQHVLPSLAMLARKREVGKDIRPNMRESAS